jgi:hypothetical protein
MSGLRTSFTRYLWGHVLDTYQLRRTGRVGSGCAWHFPARSDSSSPLARRASGSRILRVRSLQRARWQWLAWLAADESQGEEAASRRFWLGISAHLVRLFITPSLRFNCRQFSLPSHQQQQLVFPVTAPLIQKLYREASPAPAPAPPASHPFS